MRQITSLQSLFEEGRISHRLYNALSGNGFTELADLAGYDERRLRMLRSLGPSTAAELMRLLQEEM